MEGRPDFTEDEARIRDSFDDLLEGLDLFDYFVEAKLLSLRDLRPYLSYWLDIIGNRENKRLNSELREELWIFINYYGFVGTRRLLGRFGYPLPNAGL